MKKDILIQAFNRNQMESLFPQHNEIAICIYSTGNGELGTPPKLKEGWKDILYLQFDDVDINNTHGLKPFNTKQAKDILDFVKKNNADKISINCDGGVCRSVAVMVILERLLNRKDVYNKYPCMNKYVYNTIRKVAFLNGRI